MTTIESPALVCVSSRRLHRCDSYGDLRSLDGRPRIRKLPIVPVVSADLFHGVTNLKNPLPSVLDFKAGVNS